MPNVAEGATMGISSHRTELVEDLHGRRVRDPYRWLEDADSPETVRWSQEQDARYAAFRERFFPHGDEAPRRRAHGWSPRGRASGDALGPFATDVLTDRLRSLLGAGSVSTPAWRGDRCFLTRRHGDQEHPVVLTRDADGAERVLVDPIRLDPSGATTLDSWQPSKEGGLLAYQVSTGGTEESVLHVLDVATGRPVDGPIDRARYSPVAWLPGGESFFYVRRLAPELLPAQERQYHRRVWWHRIGTDAAEDVEVFGAGLDPTTYYGVSVSLDGRWLLVSASAGTAPRTDVWIAELGVRHVEEGLDLVPVAVGLDADTTAWVGRDGRLYALTDLDAPRGRLIVTDPARPADPAHWHTLVPEDPEAVLEDVVLVDVAPDAALGGARSGLGAGAALHTPLDADLTPTAEPDLEPEGEPGGDPVPATSRSSARSLLVLRRRHAVSEITAHDLDTGGELGTVRLPGLGSVGGLVMRPEGGHEVWFSYTDTTTVGTVHLLDARSGRSEVWAAPPGRPAALPDLRTLQVSYDSADGTPVRMFLTARADVLDGDRPVRPLPTILYGYGGFQVSLTPSYSATALAWVEAGGVYAVVGLRGGGEEGESWHRAGMRERKQNVFDDFHAAAEHLVDGGWTTPTRLGIWGGSNGGLLVGAAMTQRPELYGAVVCSAPLLDMVRYQRFGLGVTWTEEYGDADVPEELDWLLAYSPYHRALDSEAARRPATLFTVFDGDTRVDPLHARKLCAALQHRTGQERLSVEEHAATEAPVLIRREAGVGHGGRSLSRTIALSVEQLQFIALHTGLLPRRPS